MARVEPAAECDDCTFPVDGAGIDPARDRTTRPILSTIATLPEQARVGDRAGDIL